MRKLVVTEFVALDGSRAFDSGVVALTYARK